MSWEKEYKKWLEFDTLNGDLRVQLEKMIDEGAIKESFYNNLEFGTGGMRGELGPGINRMNIYTVRRAAEGLANYIEEKGAAFKKRGVVVAYDSRHFSQEFAIETAKVMGAHNIPTYIFTSLRPTPELSFAVRYLKTAAGVMITASHNPPEYNGYKVYNEEGGQVPPEQAEQIIQKVNKVEDELTVPVLTKEELEQKQLLRWIDEEIDKEYLRRLKEISLNPTILKEHADNLNVVFTPLHGTSYHLVKEGLGQIGIRNVNIVEEQATPDPEFSTVQSPNPEEHQAFEMAIQYGEKTNADILIGTDPDADRLGVAVKNHNDVYQVLTGNQLGALLLDYILKNTEQLPDNGVLIKTIVTSEFGKAIASHYGVKTLNTLTGFKFIGEKIQEFEETGQNTFLFGYEESYGFLISDFARDKDAVQAAVLACEMAAVYKAEGKSLYEALEELYEKHGYYLEDLHSITLKGIEGTEKIKNIMSKFRKDPIVEIGSMSVEVVEDYQSQERRHLRSGEIEPIHLPKSNVVKFVLNDDCWFCLRPSGTEPKIKFYFAVKSNSYRNSLQKLEEIKDHVLAQIHF
ncbi:phospho-sugar mutase [Salirhabdus salicampi]|uniref:phospho-sugar mutase n=1 Tax=Salirhabdus salicampi TaxID=476102 RepID=UPI0020C222E0|nr:phospho-sugar mutase [Salirhabdus salicampi]MCP8617494.1 phospho-sugar mutase [Salirhabdus salicampi]